MRKKGNKKTETDLPDSHRCPASGNDADSIGGRATSLIDIPERNPDDHIRIIIRDGGGGIPKNLDVCRIPKPWTQADSQPCTSTGRHRDYR